MQRDYGRLPLACLCAGFAYRVLSYAVLLLSLRQGGWTGAAELSGLWAGPAIGLVLFLAVGFWVRRLDQRTLLFSASVLAIYGAVVLAVDQAARLYGFSGLLISLLWLPVEIFTPITSLLMGLCADLGQLGNLLYAIPALFAPYLFLLFGRKTAPREGKQQPSS